jgi:hypothetical protein
MSQKFHPNLKIDFETRRVNEFLIGSFLEEGSNPQFCPSLKDFTDKSNVPHGQEGMARATWRKEIIMYECTSHLSNVNLLYVCTQFISNDLKQTDSSVKFDFKKIIVGLHTISSYVG